MQESEGVLCMRVSFRIALAGQVIGVSALYEQTRTFCKNYLTDVQHFHCIANCRVLNSINICHTLCL